MPWLRAITSSDGLAVFATDFSNYTGGYITILAGVAKLAPMLSELAIIKITSVIGTTLAAIGVAACLRSADWSWTAALNGGLAFMLLPSVMLNGIAWAQADAFYAAFVLFAMASVLSSRIVLAIFFFAVAVSFKLQAIFFAPFLLGILLRAPGRLFLGLALAVPVYLAVNGIYLLAGRPVSEVLLIYLDQAETVRQLSRNAANLWLAADLYLFLHPDLMDRYYRSLIVLALALAGIAGIVLAWRAFHLRDAPVAMVALAALTVLVLPFLLPKMHERYFYPAETFLFLACLLDRRFMTAAIAVQLSAMAMYSIYHDTLGLRMLLGWIWVAILGVLLMMTAIALTFRNVRHQRRHASNARSAKVEGEIEITAGAGDQQDHYQPE